MMNMMGVPHGKRQRADGADTLDMAGMQAVSTMGLPATSSMSGAFLTNGALKADTDGAMANTMPSASMIHHGFGSTANVADPPASGNAANPAAGVEQANAVQNFASSYGQGAGLTPSMLGLAGTGSGGLFGANVSALGAGTGYTMEGRFPCVRLRGLPFEIVEEDIAAFLGFEPVDTLMVHRDGRFGGEAFIVCGTPPQFDAALGKNKSYMGRRYVEVFRAKKMEYYKAVAAEYLDNGPTTATLAHAHSGSIEARSGSAALDAHHGAQHSTQQHDDAAAAVPRMDAPAIGATTVLRLRGLPYSAQASEVAAWFADLSLSRPVRDQNVLIVLNAKRRSTGTAYVEFASPEDAQIAASKHGSRLGSRYIELFASSPDELRRMVSTVSSTNRR